MAPEVRTVLAAVGSHVRPQPRVSGSMLLSLCAGLGWAGLLALRGMAGLPVCGVTCVLLLPPDRGPGTAPVRPTRRGILASSTEALWGIHSVARRTCCGLSILHSVTPAPLTLPVAPTGSHSGEAASGGASWVVVHVPLGHATHPFNLPRLATPSPSAACKSV